MLIFWAYFYSAIYRRWINNRSGSPVVKKYLNLNVCTGTGAIVKISSKTAPYAHKFPSSRNRISRNSWFWSRNSGLKSCSSPSSRILGLKSCSRPSRKWKTETIGKILFCARKEWSFPLFGSANRRIPGFFLGSSFFPLFLFSIPQFGPGFFVFWGNVPHTKKRKKEKRKKRETKKHGLSVEFSQYKNRPSVSKNMFQNHGSVLTV